jgi:hypothetical protein
LLPPLFLFYLAEILVLPSWPKISNLGDILGKIGINSQGELPNTAFILMPSLVRKRRVGAVDSTLYPISVRHSSDKDSMHDGLAKAVEGQERLQERVSSGALVESTR